MRKRIMNGRTRRDKMTAGSMVCLPVHNDQLHIDILSIFVQEIGHEIWDRLVGNMTA